MNENHTRPPNTAHSQAADHSAAAAAQPSSTLEKFLHKVEYYGNKLPDISVMFLVAFGFVMVLSLALSFIDFDYVHPISGEKIAVKNMFAAENLSELLARLVSNFIGFPALAIVLAATLGVSLAEGSGLIRVLLIKLSELTPKAAAVPVVLLIAVFCHIVSDSAYVFLMPIAAYMFIACGRHPVAGIAASFAALAGGFTASYIPSVIDPLMQQFTQAAAHTIDPSYDVNVLSNYFFSIFCTFFCIGACWLVSAKIVEPMCEKYMPLDPSVRNFTAETLTATERRGLLAASAVFLLMAAAIAIWAIPADSALRAKDGSLTASDARLMRAIVPLVFVFLAVPGYVYGKVAGTIKTSKDLSTMAASSLNTLSSFIVFCFVCGQFLYAFNTSNLSTLLAISGAELLKSLNMPSYMTLMGVIIFTSFLNIFITSASSKWAILSVIFVPMLMLLGISPELTQAAYRTSDSAVNIITPLFPFYPLVLSYCQRYYKDAGIGTIMSIMLPYGIALWIALVGALFIYYALDWPLGFDAQNFYDASKIQLAK